MRFGGQGSTSSLANHLRRKHYGGQEKAPEDGMEVRKALPPSSRSERDYGGQDGGEGEDSLRSVQGFNARIFSEKSLPIARLRWTMTWKGWGGG